MKEVNILFIVEGSEAEPNFINKFLQVYSNLNIRFIPEYVKLKTNIYSFYNQIKKEGFYLNIKKFIQDTYGNNLDKSILDKEFMFTYLIFDCDPHNSHHNDSRNVQQIIKDNFLVLREMVEYFDDECDPTKGKLYLNYPMIESYRDCNDFFDLEYENNCVELDKLKKYKYLVGKKKLCNKKKLADYSRLDFDLLTKMNIYKLNKIVNRLWLKCSYEEYSIISKQTKILENELEFVKNKNVISILNTLLFWMIDYFGNRNSFYDNIVNFEAEN